MLQYMRWENNQQGMADSISILSSKRAESLVRNFKSKSKEEKERDRLWIWQTLLKYRRIPPHEFYRSLLVYEKYFRMEELNF